MERVCPCTIKRSQMERVCLCTIKPYKYSKPMYKTPACKMEATSHLRLRLGSTYYPHTEINTCMKKQCCTQGEPPQCIEGNDGYISIWAANGNGPCSLISGELSMQKQACIRLLVVTSKTINFCHRNFLPHHRWHKLCTSITMCQIDSSAYIV